MDKKTYTQITVAFAFTFLLGLVPPDFIRESHTTTPVIKSSVVDFIEPILETTLDLARQLLLVLSQIFDLDKDRVLSSFAALTQIVKEQPLILFGMLALILGTPFMIYRSIMARREREKRLRELKESLEEEEDDVEAEMEEDETPRPLVITQKKPADEEDDDDESFRPLTVAENRYGVDPYDKPASESIMANLGRADDEDSETDGDNKKDHEMARILELDFEAIENATIGAPAISAIRSDDKGGENGGDDDDIIKKLDEEFEKLETTLQATDSPPEISSTSNPSENAKTFPAPESAEVIALPIELAEEAQISAEAPTQNDGDTPVLILDAGSLIEEESPKELGDTMIDLQAEMEKTIRELSEQLQSTPKYDESPLGGAAVFEAPPAAQPSPPATLEIIETHSLGRGDAESESSFEENMDPELAEMLKAAMQDEKPAESATTILQPVEIVAEAKTPPPQEEPGEIAEIASNNSLDQIHEYASINIPPPPAARKRERIPPEKSRHYVSRLLSFQKGLENRLQKLAREKKPEATRVVAVAVPAAIEASPVAKPAPTPITEAVRKNPALQTAKKNYENKKSAREKGSSLELLESFIMPGIRKK